MAHLSADRQVGFEVSKINFQTKVTHARFHGLVDLIIFQIDKQPKEFNPPVKTKECPSCAMEVDAKAKNCPICQFEFPKRSPWITWMAIFLVLVWLLSYLL